MGIQRAKAGLLMLLAVISISSGRAEEPRAVVDFDFDWKFTKENVTGAQQPDFDDSRWQTVNLPHDWSIEGPYSEQWASCTGYLPGGVGWYRKTFTVEPAWKGKIVLIEFDGVYKNSEVWINGHYLGMRPFGYIGFQYELTEHLRFDGPNVVAVRADHSDFADSRWYSGSGIYRHVRLIITSPLHFVPGRVYVQAKPLDGGKAALTIESTLLNASRQTAPMEIILTVFDPAGHQAASQKSNGYIEAGNRLIQRQNFTLEKALLWCPEQPLLYRLEAVLASGETILDRAVVPFGIRSIRFDPNEGFFLNGQNLKIKGVCLHHDGGPLGAAVPEKLWRTRLKQLREIGCNAIRTSHNPPAPELLDLCDQMGFLVMDEAFDEFTPPKKKWIRGRNKGTPGYDGYGKVFEKWAVTDIQDMVRRDRNHPSIILWSIGNEIDFPNDPFSHPSMGDEYKPEQPAAENLTRLGRPLVEAVKAVDKSRPVTAALANAPVSNVVGFADLLDVVGYNYQEHLYPEEHRRYPNRCILGSENSFQYEAWKAVLNNPYAAGQFLWVGFDYLGEAAGWPARSWTGGLFDLCGYKKPAAWQRQSWWSEEPMVYLAVQPAEWGRRQPPQSHWNWAEGKKVWVLVYSNCQEVELVLNGRPSEACSPLEAPGRPLRRQMPFESGVLTAIGKNEGRSVCQYTLRTAGPAEQVRLVPDCSSLIADGKDVALIEFLITDAEGVVVPDASDSVSFTVSGPGHILAVGNGDPAGHESHKGDTHRVYQGRGLLAVQSERQAGSIEVQAVCGSLKPAVLVLPSKPGGSDRKY